VQEHLETVRQYHEITKHHPQHYARGPGQLDWSTQPDPFRRYLGAHLYQLEVQSPEDGPHYDAIWTRGSITPTPINRHSVSRLFLDSLALSAWKRAGGSTWSLRVNPSAGNLHPSEGYLVCGAVDGLCEQPMVAHYAPKEHLLERRMTIPPALWQRLMAGLPDGSLLVGLTSIHWRSSWKYGERSYRYVHLDLGHALAAVCIAAAGQGWETRLMDQVSTDEVAQILCINDPAGVEPEEAGCLLLVTPGSSRGQHEGLDRGVLAELASLPREGKADRLSPSRVDWPVIEEVAEAACKPSDSAPHEPAIHSRVESSMSMRDARLRPIIHQRRSALDFDGITFMSRSVFFGMLQRTLVHEQAVPLTVYPWAPLVHLVVFVHRVEDLPAGLYLLDRDPGQRDRLRLAMNLAFEWDRPQGCPKGLDLVRLVAGDMRKPAMQIACMQASAGDGCFSLAMIADLEKALNDHGPWMYPRLHWECGLLGQILYLEAEAAGLRGCGLGCYYDDLMHEVLGLKGKEFQDLYHFTVGRAVEDPRISTLPAYR
jgi:SagB-type dehydrogenase family enzyme